MLIQTISKIINNKLILSFIEIINTVIEQLKV